MDLTLNTQTFKVKMYVSGTKRFKTKKQVGESQLNVMNE